MQDELSTFSRGGIVTDDRKTLTSGKPIERFVPKEVVIPLIQHLGNPCRATVARKAKVTRGDRIGNAIGGVPIHASVSGVVKRVALQPHPTLVEAEAVVIETASELQEPVWEEVSNWEELSKEKMLEQIADAGIVGLGGATFPTHRKLNLPEGIKVDTLILNGAECEPYLTSDHRLLLEQAKDVVWGAVLIAKIVGAQRILIGIEENKIDAAEILNKAIAKINPSQKVFVVICKTRYPQGSEKQLVEALTYRAVPSGKLPMHVGVLVQNVATAVACYSAIRYRKPLLDRMITVTGRGIMEPKNLIVPIGTLVQDIVDFCGGLHPRTVKVISGGPMMGKALGRLDCPVIKGTGGLIFLTVEEVRREHYGPCISCGRCLDACPLGLEPNQISIYTEAGRQLETESFGTKECFECGCCAFVCPAMRPLVQFIQVAKQSFMTREVMHV
ncbi:MAG: hypothetical protein A3F82_06015 [Deltaproteobacteria bacterium RIFCSPLOWO2_12_FULL_44_12]|nr:MAG: hypothetical protein A2712_01290 [Deltaproteobacteria bacterium RIFCSPHIGHO2_01_FULL_43_49]OGQ15231.1 MAG: hypothetical protein A3D22_04185 [Deltaproteobacteria bacterium RIFCSPHIGHO2_02_FULL_44_53]OGQ27146.1 MAG: hypothetical protein A3D98_01880 [Deltaproteobacteria bacterium RIFCSPHIGHO2_12_FULL_44_21]OGQ31845.1 MAG: hypothetical protein A2979_05345 [Deltaproteobacteria bacterium RIFCSPLOWO2_01_FULL_45_74]OGQ42948.1 MAG: hypothetical protein A3I70_07650 [Deltaproteobacteria bacterium 